MAVFKRINITKKTCLILARISSRFLVSQPGVWEMEYWNIYQSVAYSAEGPLCVLVWSFTTRSQIKYLSHLNKKGECRVSPSGSVYVCECVSASVCLPRAWVHEGRSEPCAIWDDWCGVPGGGGVLSLSGWRYATHLPIYSFTETGISLSLTSARWWLRGLQQTQKEQCAWPNAAVSHRAHSCTYGNKHKKRFLSASVHLNKNLNDFHINLLFFVDLFISTWNKSVFCAVTDKCNACQYSLNKTV